MCSHEFVLLLNHLNTDAFKVVVRTTWL